jgi:hypothetical protein
MNISKSSWTTDGNTVRLSMPIAKVDQERRTVSGFATLDNVDLQGDIVPTDASVKAFETFRGNLREMHQQIAVGKVVSFKEDKYFDTDSKKFYNGVYVSAYVSKGAQDTWEKVLDGTLTGFSIGGNIKESEDVYSEDMDKSIRIIKDYELYELSLVDNPANQFANVISIEKNQDGGYLSKTLTENIFWCGADDLVQMSAKLSSDCPRCDKGMQNIGFVETNDAEKAEVVKSIISKVKQEEKEVNKMEEEKKEASADELAEVEKAEEKSEDLDSTEKAAPTGGAMNDDEMDDEDDKDEEDDMFGKGEDKENSEKAVEKDPTEEVSKSEEATQNIEDVAKNISDTLTSTLDTLTEVIKALNLKVEDLHKTVSGVSQEVSGVNKDVQEFKSNFDEFGKRVDAVENDTAFRKSGDLGEIVQEPFMVQKSVWGGRFLKKSDLFN